MHDAVAVALDGRRDHVAVIRVGKHYLPHVPLPALDTSVWEGSVHLRSLSLGTFTKPQGLTRTTKLLEYLL